MTCHFFVFVCWRGRRKHFHWSKKYFRPIRMFSCPPSINKNKEVTTFCDKSRYLFLWQTNRTRLKYTMQYLLTWRHLYRFPRIEPWRTSVICKFWTILLVNEVSNGVVSCLVSEAIWLHTFFYRVIANFLLLLGKSDFPYKPL